MKINEIEDLNKEISESLLRIKELEEQDESGFAEWETSCKGKEENIPLLKNQINYYTNQLKELNNNNLSRWMQ